MFALLAGCDGTSIAGSVDGEPVGGARSAFYDTVGLDLGPFGTFESTVVMVASVADGCEVFDAFLDDLEGDCEDICGDYVPLAEEYGLSGQDSAWNVAFAANTSDGFGGTFVLDPAFAAGDFTLEYREWDTAGLADTATCEDACERGELLTSSVDAADAGSLELVDGEDGVIEGSFDVQLAGDDELAGEFTAEPCDMDGWLLFL